MTDQPPELDATGIQTDIHGERVGPDCPCDYCGEPVDTDRPVLYDVVRVAALPALRQVADLPPNWLPDAVRCPDCHRETVSPATDGFEEALVTVSLAASNGHLRIDASSIDLVDYSPTIEGYSPPAVSPPMVQQSDGVGIGRWLRVAGFLNADSQDPEVTEYFTRICANASDVPPELA